MKIRSSESQVFPCRWTDGRTLRG